MEDSFQLRNYGTESGELYKPESMDMGGGKAQERPDGMPEGDAEQPGGMDRNSGGADLNYTDDDLDSYETIWDGEVTKTNQADHERVVKALKNIAAGNDLETYMDIDNLLRYMAVHVFSVNVDSLSGMMAHNYYLYESDGKLSLIPWDYNLALGGMGGMMPGGSGETEESSGATSVVNSPIDDAFSGTDFFDTLLENETYHSQYEAYLQQLVSEYINGGGFDAFYERVRSQIDELVETDPTAFYSYDEYETAAETLYYLSPAGPARTSGGRPVRIGDALGRTLTAGAAGTDGTRWYLSAHDPQNAWHLFVYDTRSGLWSREDAFHASGFARHDGALYAQDPSGVWRFGTGSTAQLESMLETGDFVSGSPDCKRLLRVQLRLEADAGASVTAAVQYDSDGVWHTLATVAAGAKRSVTLPVLPRRCDHFRLRLTGTGAWRLLSLARTETAAGPQH